MAKISRYKWWKLQFGEHMCKQPGFENMIPEDFIGIMDSYTRLFYESLRERGVARIHNVATVRIVEAQPMLVNILGGGKQLAIPRRLKLNCKMVRDWRERYSQFSDSPSDGLDWWMPTGNSKRSRKAVDR